MFRPARIEIIAQVLLAVMSPAAAAKVKVEVVQTSANLSQHLTRLPDATLAAAPKTASGKEPVVVVNGQVKYQHYGGMGAALTDSSACLISRLSPGARDNLLRKLFSAQRNGANLNFLRVPMGASDFSCSGQPYSYDDQLPGQTDDAGLSGFSITHDRMYIIPALQQIVGINPQVQILANPWSAPPWMKTNDAFNNVGGLGILPQANYPLLAMYFQKFVQAYATFGIHIAEVTPQNEPGAGTGYPGMDLSEPDEASFITQYLQPAMNGLGVKVYGYDSSWTWDYVNSLIHDTGSSLDGVAWHCYGGNPTVMSTFQKLAPQLNQIVSECSPELRPFSTAEEAIASYRNWASTVGVWNVALDPSGGPVELPNWGCHGCTGVVTVNPGGEPQVSFGPKYYQLGQFSRFVRPGARRIGSNNFVNYANWPHVGGGLDDVAFQNPDGSKVLVVYNTSGHSTHFGVEWKGRYVHHTIPPRATTTFIWK